MERSKRILCVDDDKDTCEMLTTLLELEGYKTVQSHTAAEALSRATAETFDLIILDWTLRGMTGLELCKRIISSGISAPILFCSGNDSPAALKEATGAGASGFLVKPVDPGKLLETVSRLAGR